MASARDEDRGDREQTDESLCEERRKTDHALDDRSDYDRADVAREKVRDAVDAKLDRSRERADEELKAATGPEDLRRIQERERVRADEATSAERSSADA